MTLAAALVITLALVGPAGAADPFRAPRPPVEAAAPLPEPPERGLLARFAETQASLNERLAGLLRAAAAERGDPTAFAALLGVAFAFGVLHAAGPGHGKAVVASYLLASRERWLRGAALGAGISFAQGAAAIAGVGLLAGILKAVGIDLLGRGGAALEAASYALIAVIGLVMLHGAWRRPAAGCAHAHHHGHHHHGHHHEYEPDLGAGAGGRSALAVVLASGLTPCASAVILLLFAVANGVFFLGAQAALAMSAGMAVTVAGVGLLTVTARRAMERVAARDGAPPWLLRGLSIASAALLVVVSSLLCLGAAVRV